MSLPDNASLKALIDASTPVPWHREIQTTADGYGRACGPDVAIPSGDAEMLVALTRLDKDAQLIALAPALAAEVIRLRDEQTTTEARMVIYCLACGDVGCSDEDYCCPTCGRDLVTLANSDASDAIAEWDADYARSIRELTAERNAARKEAEELRAQLTVLTGPSPAAQLERYRAAQKLVNE